MARARRFVLPILILFLGIGLRFHALAVDARLHPDEALFATFARSAATNGAWLLPGALDKPPLSIYAAALSMTLFTTHERPGLIDLDPYSGEFAARLPNVFGGIVLMALAYALAWALYRRRGVALLGMLLVALSPYGVAFNATAFTDGLMLLGMVAALVAVARGRWAAAGLCLGLAFLSKPQGLFYGPLVVVLGWAVNARPRLWRRVAVFALTLLACIAALGVWDAARNQPDGVWALAAAHNDPWRLLRADELWPRLWQWLAHGQWLFGPPLLTAGLIAAGIGAALYRLRVAPRRRATLIDMLLLAFVLAYGGLHWLVAFNTYDRYLLPLVPVLALLVARGVLTFLDSVGWSESGSLKQPLPEFGEGRRSVVNLESLQGGVFIACAVLVLLSLFTAIEASERRIPIGGDQGEMNGIDVLAGYLNSRAPGAIVYDHWLGWELDYYLGQWTDKRRVYYPTPAALVEDALLQPDAAPRYFVVPAAQAPARWLDALATAEFRPALDFETVNFRVYVLTPPSG